MRVLDDFENRVKNLEGTTDGLLEAVALQRALQLGQMGRAEEARSIVRNQLKSADAAIGEGADPIAAILCKAAALKNQLTLESRLEAGQPDLARAELLQFLASQAKAHPDATALVQMFLMEHLRRATMLARTDPDETDAVLDRIENFLKNEGAEASIPRMLGTSQIDRVRQRAESTRRMLALVGSPAVYPENVDAWVNGDALSVDDMKGKVVLLDFFAVWCGPCVATFPHLKQWHDKFAERGLHIVGITRYYQYGWDAEAERPKRESEVEPAQERKAMEEFLQHHGLQHRVAFVTDSQLQDHYGVSGIPHAVLIDRAGNVRLYRVGSGPQNAVDLEEAIKECLDESPSSQ